MTTIAYYSVNIQTSAQSVPSVPAWFGEVTDDRSAFKTPGRAYSH
jgi:hypothetical protein